MHDHPSNPCPIEHSRRLYARAMSQWALDLLDLRRLGAEVPGHRRGFDEPAAPSLAFRSAPNRAWINPGRERDLLAWRPSRRAA